MSRCPFGQACAIVSHVSPANAAVTACVRLLRHILIKYMSLVWARLHAHFALISYCLAIRTLWCSLCTRTADAIARTYTRTMCPSSFYAPAHIGETSRMNYVLYCSCIHWHTLWRTECSSHRICRAPGLAARTFGRPMASLLMRLPNVRQRLVGVVA